MDLAETVKGLQSDLKNAREFSGYVTEALKNMKADRDDDLHRKMDEILRKLGNQNELERKIDVLTGENEKMRMEMKKMSEKLTKMEGLAEEITNSKEIRKIIDTVETTEGYSELFVKDFDRIHGKLQEMDGIIAMKTQVQYDAIEHQFTEINGNFSKLLQKLDVLDENNKHEKKSTPENENVSMQLGSITEKLELNCSGIEQTATAGQMSNSIMEQLKEEMENKWKQIVEIYDNLAAYKPAHRCYSCKEVLPKNLNLREDNVSVRCQCAKFNILTTSKEGYKWMYVECKERNGHYQQFPLSQKAEGKKTCEICGKEGKLESTSNFALPY